MKIEAYSAGNLYITNNRKPINNVEKHVRVSEDNSFEMFYNVTDVPSLITFEAKQLFNDYEQSYGYVWSSRAGCVNATWGTRYIDCCVDSRTYGIDIDYACSMLKEYANQKVDGVVDVRVRTYVNTSEDITYILDLYVDDKYVSRL